MSKTITIPYKDAIELGVNTNAVFKALKELIELISLESELKKHHRAYLHVREDIDKKVAEARLRMVKFSCDMLRMSFIADVVEDPETADADCASCGCLDCDRDCLSCKVSPCYGCDDEDYPFEESEGDGDSIILSKQRYAEMIDDLLSMAELIDMVSDMRTNDMRAIRELRKYIPAFAAFEENRLRLYRDAAKEAESIMERWEDEYDPDYEPDEYFSD